MTDIQPPILIGGFTIQQPVTSFTDLIVAAVCFFAFFDLFNKRIKTKATVFYDYFFLFMALSTLMGGLGHAFIFRYLHSFQYACWLTGMVSVSFMTIASILYAKPYCNENLRKAFLLLNIIELSGMMIIVLIHDNFQLVAAHSSFALVNTFIFHLISYRKEKHHRNSPILWGISVSLGAGIVHAAKLSVNIWYNHNDISHTCMAISVWLFYIGAVRTNAQG